MPWKFRVIQVICVGFLAGCGGIVDQRPQVANQAVPKQTVSDRSGANRVVSLTNISADVIAQAAPEKLVGMTGNRFIDNESRFKQIPRVAQGRSQPNLEKIVALKPDLVVGLGGVHDAVFNKMRSLKVNEISTEVTSFATLDAHIRELAQAINAIPDPIIQKYQTCFQNQPTQAPTVLALISSKPILSANEQGWTGDLLKQLGFKNLAADLQGDNPRPGYLTLSPEKVLQANPDVLLVVDFGRGLDDYQALSFWNQLQATKSNRVYALNYFGFINPGSVEAVAKTCEQLKQIATGDAKPISVKP